MNRQKTKPIVNKTAMVAGKAQNAVNGFLEYRNADAQDCLSGLLEEDGDSSRSTAAAFVECDVCRVLCATADGTDLTTRE